MRFKMFAKLKIQKQKAYTNKLTQISIQQGGVFGAKSNWRGQIWHWKCGSGFQKYCSKSHELAREKRSSIAVISANRIFLMV